MSEITEIIEESTNQLEIIDTNRAQIEVVGDDKNIIEISFSGSAFNNTSLDLTPQINILTVESPSDSTEINITDETTIFEGTASEAVRLFPKNVNVSALLSLAGLGSHETMVKVIVNPNITKNIHKIESTGKFGTISSIVENVPDQDNPKTSRLAILSAIETLRSICTNGIKLGT